MQSLNVPCGDSGYKRPGDGLTDRELGIGACHKQSGVDFDQHCGAESMLLLPQPSSSKAGLEGSSSSVPIPDNKIVDGILIFSAVYIFLALGYIVYKEATRSK